MTVAERGMGAALSALQSLASSEALDRIGLRKRAERLVYSATKNGFKAAATSGRAFTAVQKLGQAERQKTASSGKGMFDITPSDEQEMLVDAFTAFAAEQLRPVAQKADADCAAPEELLAQANELGTATLGIPEALGGVMEERSAVTTVLVAEALAKGDLGLAAAVLSPAAVATAISLYGDADQQAKYLPPFAGDDVPAAALAILEPQPLFDPFELTTTASKGSDGGYVLRGEKSLVLRAADAELFVVAAALDGEPRLFIVEAGADVKAAPQPAMGLRPAGTGTLLLGDVAVPASALLGSAEDYADAIRRSRIAWCALSVGCAQAALDHLIPYVNERQAFGEPISNRQAVAFTISNIAIELEGMRLTTYRAAALADRGKPFAREAAVARQLCAEKGMQIGSDAVQMLGGHGYVKEYHEERWYRDLRAAGVMEGALLV
jgi:alkylation response protein AidB-like acyl-CoA dehydrogenase